MPKVIASKYQGWCGLCRGEFAVDDPICWLSKPITGPQGGVYKFAHPECLAEERDSEPPTKAKEPVERAPVDNVVLAEVRALRGEVAAIRAILSQRTDTEASEQGASHA